MASPVPLTRLLPLRRPRTLSNVGEGLDRRRVRTLHPGVAGPPKHSGPHCVNDGTGDVFIGWRELVFPVPDLGAALPNVGDTSTETVALTVCPEGTDTCGSADFPHYTFTCRTTRLADVRTDFRLQLRAAIERSGIADPDDAIAAGLRSLEAPVEREAETEDRDTLSRRDSD